MVLARANRAFIEKLRRAGVDFGVAPAVEPRPPQVLAGKAVVVSGTLADYRGRRRRRRSTPAAARAPGSVSAKTYALVVGDNPGASKVTKAEQVGVPILDEAAFERLLETGELCTPDRLRVPRGVDARTGLSSNDQV